MNPIYNIDNITPSLLASCNFQHHFAFKLEEKENQLLQHPAG